jgi:prolyl oligopeptidase PreP (S9A serine peptidase family)
LSKKGYILDKIRGDSIKSGKRYIVNNIRGGGIFPPHPVVS